MSAGILYLYGLIDQRPLPDCRGVCGAPLRSVEAAGLAAVVSELSALPEPTEELLWEHESVLEALLPGGAVLPVRFGVVFREPQDLVHELEGRRGTLSAAVERVRGRAEIAVRVVEHAERRQAQSSPRPAASGPGTQYLLARTERQLDAAGRVAPIRAALRPLAVEERARLLPRPATLLTAAYLVDASKLDAFRYAVAQLHHEVPGVGVVCTGPWPPYNFVEAA